MPQKKRVGNIIYSLQDGEFSMMMVDGQDVSKGVNLCTHGVESSDLSISNVEFTQSLLEEAHAVLAELKFAEEP